MNAERRINHFYRAIGSGSSKAAPGIALLTIAVDSYVPGLSESEIAEDNEYYHHNTNDVENVHVGSSFRSDYRWTSRI
jgi:hypothetical protein